MEIDIEEVKKAYARLNLFNFTKYLFPEFEAQTFHYHYYKVLDMFAKGEILNLIITMPPQHGKSTGSTMFLPAYIHGLNPNLHIAVSSYSTPITQKFNRHIQRIIDTPEYHSLFPETNLGTSNIVTVSANPLRNASVFEIVDLSGKVRGKLMSVGRGGGLTSESVDVWIGDDLYKDYAEGNSPIVRDAVWEWYVTVPVSRQPKQKLKVFTRWHQDDSIGRIEQHELVVTVNSYQEIKDALKEHGNDVWIKINFEAIKEGEKTEFDSRELGESLWESKRPLKNLLKIKALDLEKFNCLYQGNPESKEGMLYDEFRTYNRMPETRETKNYTDTADTGTDYLCSINYKIPLNPNDTSIYITDILYTIEPMELTEGWTADMLIRGEVNLAEIESNNGGRGFARAVEKMVNANCIIEWFHQGENKESRIHTRKAAVMNRIVFPSDWKVRFPEFHKHLSTYKKLFKANKQDGGPDVLSGIIERNDQHEFYIY